MNELVERLARESGLIDPALGPWMIDYGNAKEEITRFAQLVAEDCAHQCDALFNRAGTAEECADAIRAKFGVTP